VVRRFSFMSCLILGGSWAGGILSWLLFSDSLANVRIGCLFEEDLLLLYVLMIHNKSGQTARQSRAITWCHSCSLLLTGPRREYPSWYPSKTFSRQ
jgi:hypothetical protein